MRLLVLAGVIAACVVGAALAQDESPSAPDEPQRFTPRYARTSVPQLSPYPAEQMGRRSGAVVLCCRPDAERRLSCSIAFEAPARRGFGEAVLRYQQQMNLLTEESYAAYQASYPEGGAFPALYLLSSTGSGEVPDRPNQAERDALCAAR